MALRKASEPAGLRRIEPRDYIRDGAGLTEQLQDPDAGTRRWAARDLAEHPGQDTVAALCSHLLKEQDASVREVIFTTLTCLGGSDTVDGLLPLLRSEDANLRNSAIETLSSLPEPVGPRIDALLKDADPDVRIFTVNLLGDLRHPEVGRWLSTVMTEDPHVNVVGAALEVLAEVGAAGALPALKQARLRFADDPFIGFAADLAEQRIEAP
jgi:HEAT repeat protein